MRGRGPWAIAPGAFAWVAMLAAGGRQAAAMPVAMVFESGHSYLEALRSSLPARALELVPCSEPQWCSDLPAEICERVVAVVGQPKDMTLLTENCLSSAVLLQSTTYMYPSLESVPPRFSVATYMPDWKHVYGVEPIAEFVIASVFHWNYRLQQTSATFADCAWGDDAPRRCPPLAALTSHKVLMNQTIGVLGYGSIGQAVAQRAAAMGMRVVATRRHGPFQPPPPPLAWLSDDNDQLLRESDFVVLTVPGTLRGLINETSLGLMRPDAVLVPTSAPPVDFDALYGALAGGRIGGAVVDVWEQGCWHFPETRCGPPYGPASEPSARPLHRLENVLALPGVAMRDAKFWEGSASFVAGNLAALVNGQPVSGVVRNGTNGNAESTVTALLY